MLAANRSLVKYIFLGIITLGIYPLIITMTIGENLNLIATRYDYKNTINFILVALILSPITLGIFSLIWWHGISERTGIEMMRRGMYRGVSAADFWLWAILGSFIIVGPFIFMYKFLKSSNMLAADFNQKGW